MPLNPIGTRVRVWIEVALLVRQISGEKVSHALIDVQIADGSRPEQAIAVAPGASHRRQRVFGPVDDGSWRCRRTHVFNRRVDSHFCTTPELFPEPSIRRDVERR